MEHFAPPHLTVMAITVIAAVAAALVPRRVAALRHDVVPLAAAVILGGTWLWVQIDDVTDGFVARKDLPFQLSDWAVVVTVIALVTRRPFAVEMAWFWGLAGAIWAVLTPDTSRGFEAINTWFFFIAHSGVIVAACYLVFGQRIQPRPGSAWRAAAFSVIVFFVAATADIVTGANYMFLREPPARGSLLDFMGPWPWYLVTATAMAVVVFIALEAPFRRSVRACLRPRLHTRETVSF
ncbi:MAG: TIGR02206 family membrane protein [Thermoleophilia bacterium]|nr:TIGR02206 family membrane protein [Thermoleophilia bacterium]